MDFLYFQTQSSDHWWTHECSNRQNGSDKFSLYNSPNVNSEYPAEFSLENRLVCQNTKFRKKKKKRKEKYEHTYTYPNNSKAQLDHIFINKK